MSPEQKLLWRRRDVLEYSGLTSYELKKLTAAGVLVPVRIHEGGKSYFKRADVLKVLAGAPVAESGGAGHVTGQGQRARGKQSHRGRRGKHGKAR